MPLGGRIPSSSSSGFRAGERYRGRRRETWGRVRGHNESVPFCGWFPLGTVCARWES